MEMVGGWAREDVADDGGAESRGKQRESRRQKTKPIASMELAGRGTREKCWIGGQQHPTSAKT